MRRFLLLSLLAVLLTACGQIGPLYLPEEESAPAPPGVESAEDAQVKAVEVETAPVEVK